MTNIILQYIVQYCATTTVCFKTNDVIKRADKYRSVMYESGINRNGDNLMMTADSYFVNTNMERCICVSDKYQLVL